MRYHTDIKERVFHFKQPAGTSRGVYLERHSWFVEISSDADPSRRGVGECAPLPHLSCDDLPGYGGILRQFCDDFCRTGVIPFEALRPYPSMLFGLETAFRMFQSGGNQLFETPFSCGKEGIRINGLVWMGSYEEMEKRLETKLKQGFRCVKIKIGAIDFEKELSLIRHVRDRYSAGEVELRVDANGGFDASNALRRMTELAEYDIHSIEQPIRQGQYSQMAELCQSSPLPVALDEELIGLNTVDGKKALLDRVKPAYLVLKPSLHGGLSGTKEWIDLASERGIGSWITSALESNVGLNAISQFCSSVYGPGIKMPQGLGTGELYTDNIPMPLKIKGEELWYLPNF